MKTEKQNQQLYCDLHTHTYYSDGFLSPEGIVRLASIKGLEVLAITDHDHSIGYFKAKDEAKRLGITLIPGAEITTSDYHLLALNFDPSDKGFRMFLEESRRLQENKAEQRVRKLQEHGVPISMDKVVGRFPESRLGKFNVYLAMCLDEECKEFMGKDSPDKDYIQRFKHYLGRRGIVGELKSPEMSDEDTIKAVHKAGGSVGLAHAPKDVKKIRELVRFLTLGIDFLEIQPDQWGQEDSEIDYKFIGDYAHMNKLPISFGSDYHGPIHNREMLERGINRVYPRLVEMLNKGHVKIGLEQACSN